MSSTTTTRPRMLTGVALAVTAAGALLLTGCDNTKSEKPSTTVMTPPPLSGTMTPPMSGTMTPPMSGTMTPPMSGMMTPPMSH